MQTQILNDQSAAGDGNLRLVQFTKGKPRYTSNQWMTGVQYYRVEATLRRQPDPAQHFARYPQFTTPDHQHEAAPSITRADQSPAHGSTTPRWVTLL
jgi:hypothetical protein